MKWIKNIIYKYKITLETGMHIGGLKDAVEIGGTDAPVIKTYRKYGDEIKKVPIIPGSSIKGKIRSLLELELADITLDEKGNDIKKYNTEEAKLIPKLFGVGANENENKPNLNRLIVRDAYPTQKTAEKWEENEDIIEGGEVKGENNINRITSAATPRFIERIPSASIFELEIILSVYEGDDKDELKNLIEKGIEKLNDSYIGGSGSRGYGKVKIEFDKHKNPNPEERDKIYYLNKTKE